MSWRENETLSEPAHAELIALAETGRRVAVARVEAVGELARRYYISPKEALGMVIK